MKRLCIVVATLAIGQATAAELPKEGPYDVSSCNDGTGRFSIEFGKDTAQSYEFVGTIRTNPPGGFSDLMSFRCVGLTTVIDGKQSGTGVCELIDKDGDKILSQYIPADQGRVKESAIAGTGKYEGVVRSATTEVTQVPLTKPGVAQFCVHATGTYKLK